MTNNARAVLAGGCFWGMEELLRQQPGVLDSRVGYTGGDFDEPRYRDITTGRTGHAEAVEIIYDPAVLSYEKLLLWFFQTHDPTTKDRQGNDRGTQYRSAIWYENDEQKQIAEAVMERIERSGIWPGPIVTELVPQTTFWPAEEEHQAYLRKFPSGYNCHYVRPDWTLPEASPAAKAAL